MFGKRTGQPGNVATAPKPAPAAAPVAQPTPGIQAEAFAFGGEGDAALTPAAARAAESYAAKPASPAADRLDALASRPRPEAQSAPAKTVAGPKATPALNS